MTPAADEQWTTAGVLAFTMTLMVAAAALVPYFVPIPEKNMNLITQGQTTLWAGWLLMLGYYYGTSQNNTKKDSTIATLASTASSAQAALAPLPEAVEAIKIAPGEVKTVVATGEVNE
jgi:uncharacterized protein (DUF697 family)